MLMLIADADDGERSIISAESAEETQPNFGYHKLWNTKLTCMLFRLGIIINYYWFLLGYTYTISVTNII